jgi:hypothetical protein
VGWLFLGQNVFLERAGLAPSEKMKARVLSMPFSPSKGKRQIRSRKGEKRVGGDVALSLPLLF